MSAPNDWGVPDWRDESAYPKPNELSDRAWRWQFVRRMPDYREAWDRAAPIVYERLCKQYIAAGKDTARLRTPDDLFFTVSGEILIDPVEFEGLIKYRVRPRHNPRLAVPSIFEGGPSILEFGDEEGGLGATLPERRFRRTSQLLRPGWSSVLFDLSEPLPEQLERARRSLESVQQEFADDLGFAKRLSEKAKARQRKDAWPRYLRVLDGRSAGATYEEIGLTLMGVDRSADLKAVSAAQADQLIGRIERAKSDAKKWHNAALRVANRGVS